MDNGFMGKAGQQVPEMTDEICNNISARYIELYDHVTGEKFVGAPEDNLQERIYNNVLNCINQLKG
jgi:phosphoribosylaminoimidazole-succinocarboxamide synthase